MEESLEFTKLKAKTNGNGASVQMAGLKLMAEEDRDRFMSNTSGIKSLEIPCQDNLKWRRCG